MILFMFKNDQNITRKTEAFTSAREQFTCAGRDDVITGKLLSSRGECLGLYPCVLIIFKRK